MFEDRWIFFSSSPQKQKQTILGKTAPRPPALEAYLGRLEEAPPELLAVTVYHMYMALLSGGQILRRLTRAALGLDKAQPPTAASATIGGIGTAIYEFPAPAAELKERLRAAVDGMEAAGACVVCVCVGW